MADKEDHDVMLHNGHLPPSTAGQSAKIKPVHPMPPPTTLPPKSPYPEPTRLSRTMLEDVEESLNIVAIRGGTSRKPDSEAAACRRESDNRGRFSRPDHDASLSRPGLSNTPHYFSSTPFQETTIPPGSTSHPPARHLTGWDAFPPQIVPKNDPIDFTKSPGNQLRDIEKVTGEHIEQSVALREWMERVNGERKILRSVKHDRKQIGLLEIYRRVLIQAPDLDTRLFAQTKAQEIEDEMPPDHKIIVEKDRKFLNELQHTYSTFMDIKSCEDHASARRYGSDILKLQQPTREMSKAERLFGSDGSLPSTPSLPTSEQLYFLGSPPDLIKMPFDVAVAVGLENFGSPSTTGTPPSPGMPQSRSTLSGTTFPFEPFSSPVNEACIPDWFLLLDANQKLDLVGDDIKARWVHLLGYIDTLEKVAQKPVWDKQWHEPSPKWQFSHRREKGGWWKCRSGPDAPEVERQCRRCHGDAKQPHPPQRKADPKKKLGRIMDAISEAMREVAEKDKAIVLERLRQRDKSSSDEQLRRKDLHDAICAAAVEDGFPQRHCSLLGGSG
ncbi:hypothetical protein AAE478_001828 [Parahypoxylon ruwenzoriense]